MNLTKDNGDFAYRAYQIKRGAGSVGHFCVGDFVSIRAAVAYIRAEFEAGEFLLCSDRGSECIIRFMEGSSRVKK